MRSGLISDVQLLEEYPSRYSADVSRRRRWIRGDWQLLRWLFPGVPGLNARFRKNPLTPLSRWKILDNLRRSLVSPALALFALFTWCALPSPWFWTASIFAIVLVPSLIASLMEVLGKPEDVLVGQHVTSAARSAGRSVTQAVFTLLCLPHEAFFSGTAILQTLWRMLVSNRGLLEWNPSGEADRSSRTDLAGSWQSMWIAPVIAGAAAGYLLHARTIALSAASPVLALWFVSPLIAWWISKPLSRRRPKLADDQVIFLRKLARRPGPSSKPLSGPMTIGCHPTITRKSRLQQLRTGHRPPTWGLRSSRTCRPATSATFRSDSSSSALTGIATMETPERPGSLLQLVRHGVSKPLLPMYVSSVDSGNMAASLLTLRAGLLAVPDEKLLGARLFDGLDTLLVLSDNSARVSPPPWPGWSRRSSRRAHCRRMRRS